jgi:CheY-like chemotaxis protein
MIQPLAFVVYEKLLPGSQLVNRLQDLKYRVQTLADPAQLSSVAFEAKPMLVFIDLEPTGKDILGAIKQLKGDAQTSHIPVVGFMLQSNKELEEAARAAGVTTVAAESVLLNYLPQLLDQALQLE